MKLPLTYYGNPILRKKGTPIEKITDEIRQLVKDMEETMIGFNGAGLAAPQVNRSLALFLTHVENEDEKAPGTEQTAPPVRVFINPKILEYSEELWGYPQGCLSIPDPNIYGVVFRPIRIKIEATDLEGNRFTEEFSKLSAQAFMHENDHINGVLFIDRLQKKEREQLEPFLRKVKKEYENTY